MSAKGYQVLICRLLLILAPALISSCGRGMSMSGGNNVGSPSATPTVTVTISDPAVCSTAGGGPFQHIYVTVTDVMAYTSAMMPLSGGVDLTPGLAQSPMQIDLLGTPGGNCTLATLGSSTSVPTGTYNAVQIFFGGSDQVSKIPGGTKCPNTNIGLPANCAVLADGTVAFLDLITTGTSASIVGGPLSLGNGQQVVNLDVDSCASMAFEQDTGYSMDPVAHVALIPSSGSVTGKVLNAGTLQPIAGEVIVALEQIDNSGVDREIMQVAPGPDGSFVLCPVPPGTYDVVATAVSHAGVPFAATVTTGIQPGQAMGNIPLQAVPGANQAASQLTGQVTATGPGTVAGYSHIVVSALQAISVNGANILVTIPLPTQYRSNLRTFVDFNRNYELSVPAANPLVGANGAQNYQQNTNEPPSYDVDVQSSCNPAVVRTSSGVSVSPGNVSMVPTIALSSCPPA